MIERIKSFFYKLILKERSPDKLARSFCSALYISFSPWIGLQYPLVFALSWLFALNTAVVFATTSVLSNPLTYIPLCTLDYCVGYWLLHSMLGLDVTAMNPVLMERFNTYLQHTLGMGNVSVWAFVVGGNVIGITLALVFYPIALFAFKKLSRKKRR